MKYIVETRFTYGFANCWSDDDGQPLTFSTYDEAQEALKEHLDDLVEDFANGFIEDPSQISDFQITGVV